MPLGVAVSDEADVRVKNAPGGRGECVVEETEDVGLGSPAVRNDEAGLVVGGREPKPRDQGGNRKRRDPRGGSREAAKHELERGFDVEHRGAVRAVRRKQADCASALVRDDDGVRSLRHGNSERFGR